VHRRKKPRIGEKHPKIQKDKGVLLGMDRRVPGPRLECTLQTVVENTV